MREECHECSHSFAYRKDYAMKTVEEIYKEIDGSKEMQEELKKMSDEMIGEFLKKHDCNASVKFLIYLVVNL